MKRRLWLRLLVEGIISCCVLTGAGIGIAAAASPSDSSSLGAADDIAPSDSVTMSMGSVQVEVGVLPVEGLDAWSNYFDHADALLKEYAASYPDKTVGAVITFKHGVDQKTVDEIVSHAGMNLCFFEWESASGTHGGSSTLVDANLEAVIKHLSGSPLPLDPSGVQAVSVAGTAPLGKLVGLANRPDVLLVDPGPVDVAIAKEGSMGTRVESQAPQAVLWRYQTAQKAGGS
jgi:hypothetical protein